MKRRSQFKELLSGNSNLNNNRYIRLMCLAGVEMLGTIPIGTWVLWINIKLGMNPWISWADTHSNFSRVDQIPAVLWRRNPYLATALELQRWALVACALIFFAFFGFADEARKNYRLAFDSVAKRVGYTTASMSSGMTSSNGYVAVLAFLPTSTYPLPYFSFNSKGAYPNMSSTDPSLSAFPQLQKSGKRSSFDSDLSLGDVGGFLEVKEEFSPTATSSGSSGASSLPPSADDSYSFSSASPPPVTRPEPAVNRSSITPHSSDFPEHTTRAHSPDMA